MRAAGKAHRELGWSGGTGRLRGGCAGKQPFSAALFFDDFVVRMYACCRVSSVYPDRIYVFRRAYPGMYPTCFDLI